MNKTAIKNFAIWARVQLIEAAKQRAYEYEITEKGENKANLDAVAGRLLTSDEKQQRQQLIEQIRRKGYAQVMEEAAYTWFNRFIALRFMEVNGFLPSKVRVFTDENGAFKPEIMKEAMTVEIDGLDRARVLNLLDKQNNEELYKYLLITQCNALNEGLPCMFEKISSWTELLFPANLLRPDSVVGRMISDIAEDDFQEEVEIIGWLYQYYISEKHEEVIDPLHGKIIKKEDIPAATQLFTTDWVVRYILDNSLGRYWLERHPKSQLASKLTYLVLPKEGGILPVNEKIQPEELKVLDPCVGSGHFLSYAFDILLEIYRECGWSDREAARSILENNLYGLDIDDRATQLACFAVAMKARKYNRRILNGETDLNIVAMQDSDFITDDFIHFFANKDENLRKDIQELRIVFNNAKEYGSIISVPKLNYAALYERIDIIRRSFAEDIFQIEYLNIAAEQLLPLVRQAEILSGKYDIVATNPPYMNKYSARLKDYINQHFADYKGDLFSVFMFRNFAFCKENGYSGFMTPMVWMFIKTYEELRKFIISQKSIATLIQFEYSAFEEATVPICSFVLRNAKEPSVGLYFKLSAFKGGMDIQRQRVLDAISADSCDYFFESLSENYSKIPNSPIAYSVSPTLFNVYSSTKQISYYGSTREGMATGSNDLFMRFWFEVESYKARYDCASREIARFSGAKWFPYNKGGDFRKWYGNDEYLVNWENDGATIMSFKDESTGRIRSHNYNLDYIFKEGITWTALSSGNFGCRYSSPGKLADSKGSMLYLNRGYDSFYFLALMNSAVSAYVMSVTSQTLDFKPGRVAEIPVKIEQYEKVIALSREAVSLSKSDWDSFETSWDFKKHPLV